MTIPVWIQVIAFIVLFWLPGIIISAIIAIRKDRKELAEAQRISQAYWHREIQDLQAQIEKEKV